MIKYRTKSIDETNYSETENELFHQLFYRFLGCNKIL